MLSNTSVHLLSLEIQKSSPSSSTNSPRRLGAKPTLSIMTNIPSRKHRRPKQVSPLQPSAVGNEAVIVAKSSSKSKKVGGFNRQTESVGVSDSASPELMKPSPENKPIYSTGSSILRYEYHSLGLSAVGKSAGNSSRGHISRRGVAILGSNAILPEIDNQLSDSNEGPDVAHSRREGAQALFVIDTVHDLDGDKGILARSRIPQGGIILVEHPVIVLPADMKFDSSVVGLNESGFQSDPHEALLSCLDSRAKEEVLTLKDCSSNVSTLLGIINTNALDIRLEVNDNGGLRSQEQMYKALFLNISRCNHSCGPNAIWKFDRSTFALTLFAVREIHPGDEITISYINPFLPRHARRAQLQSKWNFLCHCMHCDVPWTFPGAIAQSDKARHELSTFFKRLPDWEQWCLDENNVHDLIEMHLRAMRMREMEGLEGFGDGSTAASSRNVAYMKHIDALVMCYGALADVQGFKHWVIKAREAKAAEGPESAAHLKVLDKWLREPRKFYVWGWKRS